MARMTKAQREWRPGQPKKPRSIRMMCASCVLCIEAFIVFFAALTAIPSVSGAGVPEEPLFAAHDFVVGAYSWDAHLSQLDQHLEAAC